jgi:NTE family protein
LADLPDSPNFIFCATDLGFGVNWEFCKERIGSYKAGYSTTQAAQWKIHTIAAISAAFPPVFNPYRIQHDPSFKNPHQDPNWAEVWKNLTLNDGGNYDNLGLEPLQKKCQTLLVSDGGTPFRSQAGSWLLPRLLRYFGVLDNQTRSLRRRMLHTEYGRGLQGVYWSMLHTLPKKGYAIKSVRDVIAQTRTDMDTFDPIAQAILENHGYAVMEGRLQQKSRLNKNQTVLAHLNPKPAPFVLPHPQLEYTENKLGQAEKDSLTKFWFFGRGWHWFGGKE